MAIQFFIPLTTRKAALKEIRMRISKHNKLHPKSKRIELKKLKKEKSSLGGNPFFIATIRGKK